MVSSTGFGPNRLHARSAPFSQAAVWGESCILLPVSEFTRRSTELVELMKEYGLTEAELKGDGWRIAFRSRPAHEPSAADPGYANGVHSAATATPAVEAAPPVTAGTPIVSPMTGIYYSASSPTSPPFVQEGDRIEAGQVVALIEAMKVFNEITAATSGTVLRVAAENGSLVNQGDPLLFIG